MKFVCFIYIRWGMNNNIIVTHLVVSNRSVGINIADSEPESILGLNLYLHIVAQCLDKTNTQHLPPLREDDAHKIGRKPNVEGS